MQLIKRILKRIFRLALFLLGTLLSIYAAVFLFIFFAPALTPEIQQNTREVNDVTGLNAAQAARVTAPESIPELVKIVKDSNGPISIGGGRYSMGGQIISDDSLHIDMRKLNKIENLDVENKEIVVQAGATWRDVQEYIDTHNLSVRIMQSYSNFTVGGSISVNAHGRYIGDGALVHSVAGLSLVLADGRLIEATPDENSEMFFSAVGGYGGIGIIARARLRLSENKRIERNIVTMRPAEYPPYFEKNVEGNRKVIMHNGDFFPPNYDAVYVTNWLESSKALTVTERLQPRGSDPLLYKAYRLASGLPFGKRLRGSVEAYRSSEEAVVWRNWEASYDVRSLGPISDLSGSFVLQEYFVPMKHFLSFQKAMVDIMKRHNVDVANISIRHAVKDTKTFLSWSLEDSFAFVLYYHQKSDPASIRAVGIWTRELIDEVIKLGGAYYLPYQIWATPDQFQYAYPHHKEYFKVKDRIDPDNRFRNKLLDTYIVKETSPSDMYAAYMTLEAPYRSEEQTLLTVPEWLLVFLSEDQARNYKRHEPLQFGYFKALWDFWSSYLRITRISKSYYSNINWGYHFMNTTIGIVTSGEYILKGLYENTVGRLTLAVFGPSNGATENFIGETYEEYAEFIHHIPWYEFDFKGKLGALWHTPIRPASFREVERKTSFAVELAAKSAMSRLFTSGTEVLYEPELLNFYGVIQGDLQELSRTAPEMKIQQRLRPDTALVAMPRYERFTQLVRKLKQYKFMDLAGNSKIAGSFIAEKECTFWPSTVLDEMHIAGSPGKKRILLLLQVEHMLAFIHGNPCLELEHVFDY